MEKEKPGLSLWEVNLVFKKNQEMVKTFDVVTYNGEDLLVQWSTGLYVPRLADLEHLLAYVL